MTEEEAEKAPNSRAAPATPPLLWQVLARDFLAEPNVIYHCPKGVGTTFWSLKDLGEDTCNLASTTTPGPCSCPTSTETVCESEPPSACKAEPNTVYICRWGKGSKPEVLAACMPGTMCIKSRSPEGAPCGSGTCNCTGDNEICSNAFPDDCCLEKNAVYKCASGGKPELKKSCDIGACVALSSGTDFSSSDCTCPHDGSACGGGFTPICKLQHAGIYTCTKSGAPVLSKDCHPERCKTSTTDGFTNIQCEDSCFCMKSGLFCGSTLPEKCKLLPCKFYRCNSKYPPAVEMCGSNGCTVANGDNHCSQESCTCPGSGLYLVCSADLPASCAADWDMIYHCPGGSGNLPKVLDVCKAGSVCLSKPPPEGAACHGGICDCNGDHEVCSDDFLPECNLEKNAIDKCTRSGTPELVTKCNSLQTCISLSDASCKLNASTLYKCDAVDSVPIMAEKQKCHRYMRHHHGQSQELTYVFQMFKTIFANTSFGFAATPVLNALQTLVDGFLSATNIDISGMATTAVELMYLLKFVAPASYQVEIQTYTDRVRAFQATIQECTGKKDCTGPISSVQAVLNAPIGIVGQILDCGMIPFTCAPGDVFRSVVTKLGDITKGVAGTSVPVAQTAVDVLKTLVCLMPVVNVVCPLASYADDALTRMSVCLTG
ncbi:hypothetical protein BG006_009714 [Podila minutissima]|uniref:Uncharacterized protein n=1 Tax=Podila minutissima TaxID=64525 RepID=A0A9P5VJ89_9FUNG|nr:hypothetical protein BG006_009714 [Podila minutissima]